MKKIFLGMIFCFSMNIFASDIDLYMTTENFKKKIIKRIIIGDLLAKEIWDTLEEKLQTLLEEGNKSAEDELKKWEILLKKEGLELL